jgi:hypothetical protein
MDINSASITQSTSRFLHRFHIIIFVVVGLGALGLGIFIIYQNILSIDDPHGYTSQTNNTSFDTPTSQRINALQPSDYRLPSNQDGHKSDPRSLDLSGRLNPFVE